MAESIILVFLILEEEAAPLGFHRVLNSTEMAHFASTHKTNIILEVNLLKNKLNTFLVLKLYIFKVDRSFFSSHTSFCFSSAAKATVIVFFFLLLNFLMPQEISNFPENFRSLKTLQRNTRL